MECDMTDVTHHILKSENECVDAIKVLVNTLILLLMISLGATLLSKGGVMSLSPPPTPFLCASHYAPRLKQAVLSCPRERAHDEQGEHTNHHVFDEAGALSYIRAIIRFVGWLHTHTERESHCKCYCIIVTVYTIFIKDTSISKPSHSLLIILIIVMKEL